MGKLVFSRDHFVHETMNGGFLLKWGYPVPPNHPSHYTFPVLKPTVTLGILHLNWSIPSSFALRVLERSPWSQTSPRECLQTSKVEAQNGVYGRSQKQLSKLGES